MLSVLDGPGFTDLRVLHYRNQQNNQYKPHQIEIEVQQRDAKQRRRLVKQAQHWVIKRQRPGDKQDNNVFWIVGA